VPAVTRGRHAAVYLTVFLVLTVPWVIRNAHVAGYYGFSSILDRRAAIGYGGAIDAPRFVAPSNGADVSADRYGEMRRDVVRLALEHPGAMVRLYASGFARLFIDPGAAMYLQLWNVAPIQLGAAPLDGAFLSRAVAVARARPALVAFEVALLLVFASYLLAGLYAVRIVPPPLRGALWFALAVCAYLAVVSAGPGSGGARLRHPMMPFIALLAGYSLAHVRARKAAPVPASARENRVA
jgi:hypothetical protein